MKELSIEEKAKRYDEALEYANHLINEHCKEGTDGSFHRADLQKMFPGIEESDDERRKSIIGFLITISSLKDGKTVSNEDFDSKAILEWVAWLEKQGTELSVYQDALFKIATILSQHEDKEGSPLEQIRSVVVDGSLSAMDIEKKEPKKINSYCENHCKGYQETGKCFADGECKAKRDAEQNPVWSEEDMAYINSLCDVVKDSRWRKEDKVSFINWLKFLKDRVLPQPKQELDEATQQWIDAIIKDYEEWYDVNKDHRATIQVKINILKYLRERYTWKPSKKQFQSIMDCAVNKNIDSDTRLTLTALYQYLKKLKG